MEHLTFQFDHFAVFDHSPLFGRDYPTDPAAGAPPAAAPQVTTKILTSIRVLHSFDRYPMLTPGRLQRDAEARRAAAAAAAVGGLAPAAAAACAGGWLRKESRGGGLLLV